MPNHRLRATRKSGAAFIFLGLLCAAFAVA